MLKVNDTFFLLSYFVLLSHHKSIRKQAAKYIFCLIKICIWFFNLFVFKKFFPPKQIYFSFFFLPSFKKWFEIIPNGHT